MQVQLLVQDARRDLLQDELGVTDADGMAGVGSTLVADYEVRPLGEHVHQLPFAFVAPLGADDDYAVRLWIEHSGYGTKEMGPSAWGPPRCILW